MVQAWLMSGLLCVALSTFGVLMAPRLRLLLRAKPDNRFDFWRERLRATLQFAIGQARMVRDPVAGFAHIFIFSGFMIVALATLTHFVHAYVPNWQFPTGALGRGYSLIKDISEMLVLVGVTYGLWRRLGPAPSRVGKSWEGVFVLCMILTLMLTDFLVYGGDLVSSGQSGWPWNPGGHMASLLLAPLGAGVAKGVGAHR